MYVYSVEGANNFSHIYKEINDLIRIKCLMITSIYLSNIGNIKKSRIAAIYIVVALFIYKHNESNKEDIIIKSNHLNKINKKIITKSISRKPNTIMYRENKRMKKSQ